MMWEFRKKCLCVVFGLFSIGVVHTFAQKKVIIHASDTEGCAPLSVTFSTNIENISSCKWEFSNGVSSTLEGPAVLFEQPGNYDVKLTVVYTDERKEKFEYSDFIKVNRIPKADFDTYAETFCNGDSVQFINTSENASSFIWDFGDGTNSSETHPTHIFEHAGVYTITLIAFNETGCSDVKVLENKVTVNQVTTFDFLSDAQKVCENNPTAVFTSNVDFRSYTWDFGDGSTSNARTPSHEFVGLGTYSISLEVEDNNGCRSKLVKSNYINVVRLPKVDFELSDTIICNHQEVEFINKTKQTREIAWSVGNEAPVTENQFKHLFGKAGIYDMKITLYDKNGCRQEVTHTGLITVLNAEKDQIVISEKEGCTPLQVSFTNNTADATGYHWVIADRNYNARSLDLTFNEPGAISVIAYTEHSSGCSSEVVMDSAIMVRRSDVSADVSKPAGCIPLETSFNLSSKKVTDIRWDFDNGNTSVSPSPNVIYTKPGKYDVNVSFVNEFGCAESIALDKTIHVYDTSLFHETPDPIQICTFEEVKFSGSVGRHSWQWDFGDGTRSSEKDPLHQYKKPGSYVARLTTRNTYGCPVTISRYNEIIVQEVGLTDFNQAIQSCSDRLVKFEGLSGELLDYSWDFGDGNRGIGKDALHEYAKSGYYQIQLTAANTLGCKMIKSRTALVNYDSCQVVTPQEGANDEGVPMDTTLIPLQHQDVVEACSAPFEITFQGPAVSADEWLWDFKDGSTSDLQHPTHVFYTPGEYDVDLFVKTKKGRTDSLLNFIKVIIHDQEVDFTFASTSLCEGVKINFTDISESPISWSWDFGDGETSFVQHPEKVYKREGLYQVSLISRDEKGCSKRTVHNVSVGNPNHYFSFPQNVCANDTLLIDHNIKGFDKYVWDFGDGGNYIGVNPRYVYNQAGMYTLELKVSDENGCNKTYPIPRPVSVTKPLARFEIEGESVGCDSLKVHFKNLSTGATRWLWDFGNGITSTEKEPVVTFKPGVFDVTLTAFQGECAHTIVKKQVVVVHHMDAHYAFVQESICFPVTIRFGDESQGAVRWNWSFGNGSTSTEKNPVHTFTERPAKNISLTATNEHGCKSSIQEDMPVFYQTDFEAKESTGCVPFNTVFTDKSAGANSWLWDFGDGTTSSQQHPMHTYENVGKYTVSLVTTSSTGCTDTLVRKEFIEVGVIETRFDVEFPQSLCSPLIAKFDNSSVGANLFSWDFGDGSSSSLQDPVHVYTKVGLFDVQLIAKNDLGCADTLMFKKLVKTLGPEADFGITDSVLCHPQEFQVNDRSVSAISWEWFFGDGNTSSERNPTYEYSEPGIYGIALLATDKYGCSELKKMDSIRVIKTPEAQFEIDGYEYCLPAELEVENKTKNTQNVSYNWDYGNGQGSNEEVPAITYSEPGSYRLSLTATNESVCSNTFVSSELVHVRDTFPLREPEVFQLTVSGENEIRLKANAYSRNNFKFNVVFRKSSNQSEFQVIDTIHSGLHTDYFDQQVLTSEMDYSYKIQSHVYCNNPVPLDNLNTYKSILLNTNVTEEDIKLDWTPYQGHRFDQYTILRKPENGNWEEVGSLPFNKTSFVDTEDLCPVYYSYKVVASYLEGMNFHSMSNERSEKPLKNVFREQQVEIIGATVVDNSGVLTEWKDPMIGPEKVLLYQIWRSENSDNYTKVDEVPKGINTYLDRNVIVDDNQYEYRISVINTCDVRTKISNKATSILLKKETDEYTNHLFWSPYEGWEEGVGEYLLQMKNEYGDWETIEYLSGDETSHTIDTSLE